MIRLSFLNTLSSAYDKIDENIIDIKSGVTELCADIERFFNVNLGIQISENKLTDISDLFIKTFPNLKNITPHKLRSTYGTRLYNETKDIYIVADVLGHRDVNTTKKHYAAINEENRRRVADKVKLRQETPPSSEENDE